MKPRPILKVAVPAPLPRLFDYLPPAEVAEKALRPGCRLRVPFGSRKVVGILISLSSHSDLPRNRLKAAIELLDEQPVLPDASLQLLLQAAAYYHHPVGEVIAAALPVALRAGRPAHEPVVFYEATEEGRGVDLDKLLRRAPRQAAILGRLRSQHDGLERSALTASEGDWRGALAGLIRKNWCAANERFPAASESGAVPAEGFATPARLVLTPQQSTAVETVCAALDEFATFLLDGVTGSGKTEVYLRIIEQVLLRGRQALVLVPEIGLTPQLLERFEQRFNVPRAVLHSGLADGDRLAAWRRAASGEARLVIGTRSAVFTPLPDPGLIVIDEEHDPSFKQQDGFRYSARDLAVLRARKDGIPIVLGSATPSLESVNNARRDRYVRLELPERPGGACHPAVRVIDLRAHAAQQGLSTPLITAIGRHLDAQGQVLLFLNRRGYAPTLFCSACAWAATCERCDARMTVHRAQHKLRCHHCGKESPIPDACGDCSEPLVPVGQGTERMEETLASLFPRTEVARIDRDSTQRKGSMQKLLDDMQSGHTRILIGTQMLTKGHHFPDVTLVGVLNADQGLFGSDFRANERFAQTLVQVSGRAGRADRPGEVLVQTSCPEHPLLQVLIEQGYGAFAAAALDERRESRWPPFSHLALIRAEATHKDAPGRFLQAAASLGREHAHQQGFADLQVLGPAPAPMEKRAGRFRAQLLVQCPQREPLQAFLRRFAPALAQLAEARRVRWSLDVDPIELF